MRTTLLMPHMSARRAQWPLPKTALCTTLSAAALLAMSPMAAAVRAGAPGPVRAQRERVYERVCYVCVEPSLQAQALWWQAACEAIAHYVAGHQ
jgi:hypothetical protein